MDGGWVDEWENGVLLFSTAFEEPLELPPVISLKEYVSYLQLVILHASV